MHASNLVSRMPLPAPNILADPIKGFFLHTEVQRLPDDLQKGPVILVQEVQWRTKTQQIQPTHNEGFIFILKEQVEEAILGFVLREDGQDRS